MYTHIHICAHAGELRGKYYPLGAMTKDEEDFLQSNGFLFQKPGPAQLLAVVSSP
jgi:hypothetical protein